MPQLVADCPRCDAAKITFDILASNIVDYRYGWQNWYEVFCVCRHCEQGTIFVLSERANGNWEKLHKIGLSNVEGAVNSYIDVEGFINIKDQAKQKAPAHVPNEIEAVFNEGATCLGVGCHNAAGTMFRLCVDMATRALLPAGEVAGLNAKTRRDLGLRLPWLFEQKILPEALRELSSCIKEDGNDGAHAGTLQKEEAEDLLDFTQALLERLYTEPERLRIAKERREERRTKAK